MEIRRIDHNTYDIFQGRQWSTWTRVRRARNNTYVLAGEKLARPLLKFLQDVLAPNMPINYGQSFEQTLYNCQALAAMGK